MKFGGDNILNKNYFYQVLSNFFLSVYLILLCIHFSFIDLSHGQSQLGVTFDFATYQV